MDYFPYVGAVNENANTWLEIDPSFKQNIFTASRELETTIGINPDTLYTNLKAQSEVASDATYSTKLPEAFILSEIFSYGEPIRSYLALAKAIKKLKSKPKLTKNEKLDAKEQQKQKEIG